jgi:hypothetical protein
MGIRSNDPEVTFRNERDWEAEPGVTLGVDILIWSIEGKP